MLVKHERLLELLSYDPATGIFTRRIKAGGREVGSVAGSRNRRGYVNIWVDGNQYLAHRLAWFYFYGTWPAGQLDHKDTVRNHNWIKNLRPATNQQNSMNTNLRSNNQSGFKGVSFHRGVGRFRATIRVNGRQKHLGFHDTAEEASEAYTVASLKHHGEYHRANPSP